MKYIIQIKAFLSSPSDVSEERTFVESVISYINKNEGLEKGYHINLYKWENAMHAGLGIYQAEINKELTDTDIFIGILWKRFGTPTTRYDSGSEEEFKEFLKIAKTKKNIGICFYKCNKIQYYDDENSDVLEQKLKVNAFFKQNNNNIFHAINYSNIEEFQKRVKRDIIYEVDKLLNNSHLRNFKEIPGNCLKNGIVKIYTPQMNSDRNDDKEKFLDDCEGDIYLLAHSGNSFLSLDDKKDVGRFYDKVVNRLLNKEGNFKVILLNPYSLEARKIFFAENINLYQNDISSIKTIENGINFKRFQYCLNGIDEITERLERNGVQKNKLEIRITNVATDGTIIMNNKKLFFEPYISSRFLNRVRTGLNIFEIQVVNLLNKQCTKIFNQKQCNDCLEKEKCRDNLYKTISEQFHILWATSLPLSEYRVQIHKYKSDFKKNQSDLFNRELVQLHDSWFAFDPIIGCNGNCIYCFLGPQGWKKTKPVLRKLENESSDEFLKKAYEKLFDNIYYRNDKRIYLQLGVVPISIGNKSDLFFNSNIKYTKTLIDLHNKHNIGRPIVIITKQIINKDIIDVLKDCPFETYIFYSISFIDSTFEPNVPSYKDRIKSAKEIKRKLDKEKITNIHLIHYWRPIIDFISEDIENLISELKGIFKASICIGLKINNDIKENIFKNSKILYNYINKKLPENTDGGFEIFEPQFEKIEIIANKNYYPIFKHTSCAISFVQKKADFYGTMWRDDCCNACIPEQKDRCHKFKSEWKIADCKHMLNYEIGSRNYVDYHDCIKINNIDISQEKINYLTHIIGKPIYSDSIQFSLVWPSSNQRYYYEKYSKVDLFEDVKNEFHSLSKQLERLKGITGFISVIGESKKVKVFNRFNHVKRVVNLSKWYLNRDINIDKRLCAFLVLFHDINRLPFAHNLEKRIEYKQDATTLESYLDTFDISLNERYKKELCATFSKNIHYSTESRMVIVFDSIVGFIEDPLFAMSTLGISVKKIDLNIINKLFENVEDITNKVVQLNKYYKTDINRYEIEFEQIVHYFAKRFLIKYKNNEIEILSDKKMEFFKRTIKTELHENVIFPLNNEKVSKGQLLAENIGIPYIKYLKAKGIDDPYKELFKLTDNDLVNNAVNVGIIAEENKKKYYPDL